MNDLKRRDQADGGSGSAGDEQAALFELPGVHAGRCWSVDSDVQQFKEALEVRLMLQGEALVREVTWFEQFEYARAITQQHVEQVLSLPLKERKLTYKRWRQDLGDAVARRHAKFAEHVIQNGRPGWFKREITLFPDMIVLKPSSVAEHLPVSWSNLWLQPPVTPKR